MCAIAANPMQTAWENYRLARPAIFASGDESGVRRFLPDLFRKLLRGAWEDHLQQQRWAAADAANETAARLAISIRRSQQDMIDRMSADQREARARQVLEEISLLPYRPFGVNIKQREADLRQELQMLLPEATPADTTLPVRHRIVGLVSVLSAQAQVA